MYSNSCRSRRPGRARWVGAAPLGGLHSGHLVDAARLGTVGGTLGRQPIRLADIPTALGEVAVARGVDPTLYAMRLEIDLAQEAPHRVRGDALDDPARAGFLGQVLIGPARQLHPLAHRRLAGQGDERADLLGGKGRRGARARVIAQTLGHRLIGALAPAPTPALHQRAADLQGGRRLAHALTGVGGENDPRADGQQLGRGVLTHQRLQLSALSIGEGNGNRATTCHRINYSTVKLKTDEQYASDRCKTVLGFSLLTTSVHGSG